MIWKVKRKEGESDGLLGFLLVRRVLHGKLEEQARNPRAQKKKKKVSCRPTYEEDDTPVRIAMTYIILNNC